MAKKDIRTAVREICLSLPEAEEKPSHGSPDFRVRGRSFATFVVNHHGDGRIALWLNAPPGAQQFHTEADAENYFVPPYVGPRGWLGVHLDRSLSWRSIAQRVREAYEQVAPKALAAQIGETIDIDPPTETISPIEFDPMQSARAEAVLAGLREICLALPETSEARRFGRPVWCAGKKTFANAYYSAGRLCLAFWVGADRQAMLTFDSRYRIPAYIGHNGWIEVDVSDHCDWDEVREMALGSYRHFALKRMLQGLRR
jgi:predicted DNA-binding protein (MmcQ/YjbR family)